jgi:3-deoxy-D-arabino-heptulosonate 7-phosphate (DAHP) synthase
MKTEIDDFKKALTALKKASSRLDRVVEAEVKRAADVDDLQELVDKLPIGYRGTRRIFQFMNDMEA